MSHDYDPAWDYPCIDIESVDDIPPYEWESVLHAADHVKRVLAPAMGFQEGIEIFFVEPYGLTGASAEHSVVAIYCNGTSSRPAIGFDITAMKEICDEEDLDLVHQFHVSAAHELAHAYQEAAGLDSDHEHGFDEDDAEVFGRLWADERAIDLTILNPLAQDATQSRAPSRGT